jgi:hypothetical protein
MQKVFSKLIEMNPNITYCISTIIAEYDIASAHPSACYFIYGKDFYEKLMSMDKLSRNTEIGKMMARDPTLHEKIASLLLQWFNRFCEENNVKDSNFISSTRDSILLFNKKPLKTVFEGGIVKFRNKEGEYTSYIRLQNRIEILYDNISGSLRIKGVNNDLLLNHPFIRIFKQLLSTVEQSSTLTISELLKKLAHIRGKYINNQNIDIYRSLLDNNRFVYNIQGERILSDAAINNEIIIKHDNYVNFILPLIDICFKTK